MTTRLAAGTHPFVLRAGSSTTMIRGLFDIVRKWRARRQRCRIPLGFDDHMLRDIGLTWVEIIYSERARLGKRTSQA